MIEDFLQHNGDWKSGYECAIYDILDNYYGESVKKEDLRQLLNNLEQAEQDELEHKLGV